MLAIVLAASGAFDSTAVAELLVAMGVILGGARILGELARHYGQPPIVGEIAAGVILGKTVLGRLSPDLFNNLFGSNVGGPAEIGLKAMLTISAALLLLVAGLEVDLKAINRERKATLAVAFLSMLLPFVTGFGIAWYAPGLLAHDATGQRLVFALFIGVALSITALPVIAKILMDLGLQRSELGVVVLASAVANDLIGWIGFASVLALAGASEGSNVSLTIALTIGFALLCLTVGRKVAGPTLTWVQANEGWPTGVLGTVFVTAFFAAALTEWIGVHAIFGAFLAGVLFADTGRLRERTQQSIEDIVNAVFAPLFFACIALKVDFLGDFNLVATIIVLIIAIVGKMLGGWLGARFAGMGRRECWAVGAGMTARGAMEMILAELALVAGIIGSELFVSIVIMALVTSIAAGPAIERILARSGGTKVTPLLSPERIFVSLQAATAHDAILILANSAGIPYSAIDDMLKREEQLPTGMPGAWALPHCRVKGLKHAVIAIGICRVGIDFTAPDGRRARVIVLLATPERKADHQPLFLAAIARVFSENWLIDELQSAQNAIEVKAAIHLAESGDHHETAHPEAGHGRLA
jgi:Kef-type K+ transport system membrane component KefB/mannitol/fructose-specific phosphotransferase system IIA component